MYKILSWFFMWLDYVYVVVCVIFKNSTISFMRLSPYININNKLIFTLLQAIQKLLENKNVKSILLWKFGNNKRCSKIRHTHNLDFSGAAKIIVIAKELNTFHTASLALCERNACASQLGVIDAQTWVKRDMKKSQFHKFNKISQV